MIIGIDLGTSTSEVAYINEQGIPTVIPNHLGEFITPSIVYISENLEPIVGSDAIDKLFTEPENTFLEVKRFMGTNTTLIARGHKFSPVEISSYILKYLIKCAEDHLNQKIDRVVITVPAYFTDAQRRDTLKAGEMLGITVERIINEPTAAALDYGITRREDCDYILVYDLGGGTLDVTVLELFEGVVDVMSSCGNNELGGKDFDDILIKELQLRLSKIDKVDVSQDPRAMARLKQAAQSCKIALSSAEEYDVDLPFIATKNNNPVGLSTKITRDQFELLIKDSIKSTEKQIKTALLDAGLTTKDVNLTLLVGGSTKIPYVTKFLTEELGLNPKNFVDPDLAVVNGAAIQGGIIEGTFDEDALVLTDVAPYSLSTSTLTSGTFGYDLICDILIKRNSTIPNCVSKTYYTAFDYQTKVSITAYQGESTNPEENILLDKFMLTEIPSKKSGKEPLEVTFSYDLNGILVVTAEIVSTGKKVLVTIDTSNAKNQIDKSKWVDAKNSKNFRSVIKKGEKLLEEDLPEIILSKINNLLDSLKIGLVNNTSNEILIDYKSQLLDLYKQLD